MAARCKSVLASAMGSVLATAVEYDTPKIVHIKNKKVGILNRLVQLGILAYVIVYGIVLQKGYQKTGPVSSVVTTKVKGASVYNGTEDYTQHCIDGEGLSTAPWDVGDLIIPPEQPNSFFVMTNTWITCNQTWGQCPESPSVTDAPCKNDSDCAEYKGKVLKGGNGPVTGRCVFDSYSGEQLCEITAWCPTESENKSITKSGPKIDIREFTVLVKNSVEFPTFNTGDRKRNILDNVNETFIKNCVHNDSSLNGLYCPIFSLEQIVDMIPPDKDGNKTDFKTLATLGGVVGLEITWNCNLDMGLQNCHPKYSAKRLDDPDVKISPGFNFRFTKYYNRDGLEFRKMYKAYGVLFKIEVSGVGGKFDPVNLALKLGSMLALLSIAAVISDILVLYVLGKRSYYRRKKYLNVNDPIIDDYQVIEEEDEEEASNESKYNAVH
ncbi:P2X purinoceptor 4-like isoform X2 [Halichondria panicea]|uniref:P2X purinoceptor 4-like isoform X2 n=1 Tax=Halichondria panicea TaxID=6063 RepID=UPI00312B8AB9